MRSRLALSLSCRESSFAGLIATWFVAFLLAGCQATGPQAGLSGVLRQSATLERPVASDARETLDSQATSQTGRTADWPYRNTSLKSAGAAPGWMKFIEPSNDRDWSPDQAVLPWAEIEGSRVVVHNIRNSEYRTVDDYTVHFYDKTFDLDKLTSVDFLVVPFADTPSIAHTMLSFGFADRDYLVLSVEIRKEKGEKYSAVGGFLRQYELMYVLADERDVIWKNASGWLCDVYLYRARATPAQVRSLLVDVLQRVNKLRDKPEFYNTVTNNCTTNLRNHINHLAPDRVPYDLRVLLPGYSDRLAYDLGLLQTDTSFEQTRLRARINYLAYLYQDSPDFSQKIRQ